MAFLELPTKAQHDTQGPAVTFASIGYTLVDHFLRRYGFSMMNRLSALQRHQGHNLHPAFYHSKVKSNNLEEILTNFNPPVDPSPATLQQSVPSSRGNKESGSQLFVKKGMFFISWTDQASKHTLGQQEHLRFEGARFLPLESRALKGGLKGGPIPR